RLDQLLTRYKQLLPQIEEQSERCSIIIPSKMIHENALALISTINAALNAPLHFRDLNDVRSTVQGQRKVVEYINGFHQQVNELLARGTELIRNTMTPKYVQQDMQQVQMIFNDRLQTAQDLSAKLKRILEIWEQFDSNKRRYQQLIDRLNNDLTQLISNRNAITSFQREIDGCKNLRHSYEELCPILDDCTKLLQIVSNNLLPYENVQLLKSEHDGMHDQLMNSLKIIDDYLTDLINDNDKWTNFNTELKRLETLFHEIETMFDTNMFGERPLEDKQNILERIREELGEHLHALSILQSDSQNLDLLQSKPKDLKHAITRLNQLRTLAETTSAKVHREEEVVAECRTHVQLCTRYLSQIQPWIEQAEHYLAKRIDNFGAADLSEAKQLFDKHKCVLLDRKAFGFANAVRKVMLIP
ncbi:unnamed protein product, partial [Didymodactylos carnosus]